MSYELTFNCKNTFRAHMVDYSDGFNTQLDNKYFKGSFDFFIYWKSRESVAFLK